MQVFVLAECTSSADMQIVANWPICFLYLFYWCENAVHDGMAEWALNVLTRLNMHAWHPVWQNNIGPTSTNVTKMTNPRLSDVANAYVGPTKKQRYSYFSIIIRNPYCNQFNFVNFYFSYTVLRFLRLDTLTFCPWGRRNGGSHTAVLLLFVYVTLSVYLFIDSVTSIRWRRCLCWRVVVVWIAVFSSLTCRKVHI